jgi:hypothetical protein
LKDLIEFFKILTSRSSTVVERSPRHPKVEGSSLGLSFGTEREKIVKKVLKFELKFEMFSTCSFDFEETVLRNNLILGSRKLLSTYLPLSLSLSSSSSLSISLSLYLSFSLSLWLY